MLCYSVFAATEIILTTCPRHKFGWQQVTTGMWLTRETSVTLRHPTELGNFATWDAIQGLSQIDPALTILSPHQCYDAYTKALPEMAVSIDHTALVLQFIAICVGLQECPCHAVLVSMYF